MPPGGSWRPAELEAAIAASRWVFTPTVSAKVKFSEFRRLRGVQRTGRKRDAADLGPDLEARLVRLAKAGMVKRRTGDLRRLAHQLRASSLPGRRPEDGRTIALRIAKAKKVERRSYQGFTFAELEETVEQSRAREIACLTTAVALAENAADDRRLRAAAWKRVDVPALNASRLEGMDRACSSIGGARYAAVSARIDRALRAALEARGVTTAVLPLSDLADPSGVLDRLRAEGYAIDGPRWRAEPDAAQPTAVPPTVRPPILSDG